MTPPENPIEIVLWLLGGLGLFIYGIEMMGRALQKAAGNRLRSGLTYLTSTRFHGLATGAGATALLQSSSASTVMIVGFINAGLLTFRQSISLILGANIGSTILPHLTAFRNIEELSLPILGLGFLMYFFARKRWLRRLGTAILGFGMLFFGLLIMKGTVEAYRETISEWFATYAATGWKAQVVAFLIATAATAIFQSSAATIGMLQALALGGVITELDMAIPMILGAHLGTCVTALLASLGASLSAKRAAIAHTVFNILGVIITVVLYRLYLRIIPVTSSNPARQIANAHTAIKLINVLLVLPWCHHYVRLIERIVPGTDKLDAAPRFLDYKQVDEPKRALENAAREIRRISQTCIEMMHDAVSAFLNGNEVKQEFVLRREEIVDELVKSTGGYMVDASRNEMPPELSSRPVTLFYIMNDAERIGDHAENIVELAQSHLSGSGVKLSASARAEITELNLLSDEMGALVLRTLDDPTLENARDVFAKKRDIDDAYDADVAKHTVRLARGECNVIAGIVYLELLTDVRRVANHLRNMAMAAVGHIPKRAIQAQQIASAAVDDWAAASQEIEDGEGD